MPTTPARRAHGALLAAGLLSLLTASPAAGQGRCQFGPGSGDLRQVQIPGAGTIVYVGRPRLICNDGVRIWADSAVAYTAQNLSHMIGNVRYWDGPKELRADEARYFTQVGRLQANGNTVVRDTVQGSEIRNGNMVILRATAGREEEQITVTPGFDQLRPVAFLTIKPKPDTASADTTVAQPRPATPDSLAPDSAVAAPRPPTPRRAPRDTAGTPYRVEGDQIFLEGDSYFLATGKVVIDRDSMKAYADSAEYDQVAERMLLRGAARLEGSSYTLTGRTVNIALPGGEMGSVRALREGVLVGEDLRLTAPLIEIFLFDGRMERLVAIPLPGDPSGPRTAADSADVARPVAEAEDFILTADSLEVLAPAEILDRIFAAGNARGESSARDSLNVPSLPAIALKDWLEGDTVIATFTKVELEDLPPGDTITDEYRLDQLTAIGSARSLYRLLPSDSATRPGVDAPAVHYVTGSKILIVMNGGEVDRMEVEGPTRGWHLEPEARKAAADSLAADSTLVPPDTGRARPDTAGVTPPRIGDGDGGGGGGVPAGRAGQDVALPGVAPAERGRGRRSGR